MKIRRTTVYWAPNKRQITRAFVISPVVTILFLSVVFTNELPLLAILGLPIAYASSIFIGIPLYLVLKSLYWHDWSYYVLVGLVCAFPIMLHFLNFELVMIDLIQDIVVYFLAAMLGGLVFWRIAIRPSLLVYSSYQNKTPGYIMLSLVLILLFYSFIMGNNVTYIHSKMPAVTHDFLSDQDRNIEISLTEGKKQKVILPAGIPFRANCQVNVKTWLDLLTHQRHYRINNYLDVPFFSNYEKLNNDQKETITRECSQLSPS